MQTELLKNYNCIMLNSLQKLKQKFNHVLYQSPKKKKSQTKTPLCSLAHLLAADPNASADTKKKIHKTMFFEKYIYNLKTLHKSLLNS